MNPSRRLAVATIALTGLMAGACSNELPSAVSTCDDIDALTLIAQAVPEAQTIPCFPDVPFGYQATTFDVESGVAEVGLSHAVIGPNAAVFEISRTCQGRPDDDVPTPTPARGQRVTEVEHTQAGGVTGRWIAGLGGACAVVTLNLDHPDGTRALADLDGSWTLMSRQELAARLSAATNGRLELGGYGNGAVQATD